MKIYFDNVNFNSRSGPNSFAKRLAHALMLKGHVIADPHDYDVALVFIEPTVMLDRSKPYIQRLDGVWSKPNEISWKNSSIIECYRSASGVIFQSEFNKKQVETWFGGRENSTIIRNGIDTSLADHTDVPGLVSIRKQYEHIFVSSANWHAQKRCKENINAFKKLLQAHPESCLLVLGTNPTTVSSPRIFYSGNIDHTSCLKIYSMADWMIHLAWADHCPNVVVECLSQGTPVLCTDVGGTCELVENDVSGVVLAEGGYNFEPCDYDSPPKINPEILPQELPNLKLKFDRSRYDISTVADTYIGFFENVVS